jgi:outer membrane protein TolC
MNVSFAQAVQHAMDYDMKIKQIKKDLEIAQKDLRNAKKTLMIYGGISKANTDTTTDQTYIQIGGSKYVLSGSTDNGNDVTYSGTIQLNPQWKVTVTQDDNQNDQQWGISYSPFEFGQIIDIKQKELNLATQVKLLAEAQLNLEAQVYTAYANVIQKQKLLDCMNEMQELTQAHLNLTKTLWERGKLSEFDLLEAEQRVKAIENKATQAKLAVELALLDINRLTGENYGTENIFNEHQLDWADTNRINLQATIAACRENSPEMVVQNLEIEVKQFLYKLVGVQRLSGWSINFSEQQERSTTILDQDQTSYIYSLTLSCSPIFDQTWKGKKEIIKLNVDKSKIKKADLIIQREATLKNVYHSWQMNEYALESEKDSITLAKERLRLTGLKFEHGIVSAVDVNHDREDLMQVEQDYWNEWLELQKVRELYYLTAWGKPVLE